MLRGLWGQRALIAQLVAHRFQASTVRAVWGWGWIVIQPATQVAIFTVVFASVLRARLPGESDAFGYGLYVCTGVISWNYFAELVTRGQTLFLDHAELLKGVAFPRTTLPLALVLSSAVNLALAYGCFLLALAALGRWPGSMLLVNLPMLLLLTLLGVGLGVLLGTINVFFRDVGYGAAIALQFWFWLTPIVYPATIVAEPVRSLLGWNPLFPVIEAQQQLILLGQAPDWSHLLPVLGVALALDLVAWAVFRALSPDVMEAL